MGFQPDFDVEHLAWKYINGNLHREGCLGMTRHAWLRDCALSTEGFLMSLRDPATDGWTTHRPYFRKEFGKSGDGGSFTYYDLFMAWDVHRSLRWNEIVVESDERCEECAARKKEKQPVIIGCVGCYTLNAAASSEHSKLMEARGWVPSHYYSGSKSVHSHYALDFHHLLTASLSVQCDVLGLYNHRESFVREFMRWLRESTNNAFGLMPGRFDPDLAKPKHLIRSELSRNKAGFKTFLGHTWKDIPTLPPIINERSSDRYPVLGELVESRPANITQLLEEFLATRKKIITEASQKRKYGSLMAWLDPNAKPAAMKGCATYILSDAFRQHGDGYQRAAFILSNELVRNSSKDAALSVLREWNLRMGEPVLDQELIAMVSRPSSYVLTHKYVHEFLADVGLQDAMSVCNARGVARDKAPEVLNTCTL